MNASTTGFRRPIRQLQARSISKEKKVWQAASKFREIKDFEEFREIKDLEECSKPFAAPHAFVDP